MQEKAVRFVDTVLGDSEKADEIEGLSPEEYAERKRIRINPNPNTKERKAMAGTTTKAELQETLDEVAAKVEELLDPKLTRKELVMIAEELDEIVNGPEEEDDDEEDDETADDDDE